MIRVSEDDDTDAAGLAIWVEIHSENSTPSATCREFGIVPSVRVGIPRDIEEEGEELSARLELTVFRSLERRCTGRLGESVGVEGIRAIHRCIVHRNPRDRIAR